MIAKLQIGKITENAHLNLVANSMIFHNTQSQFGNQIKKVFWKLTIMHLGKYIFLYSKVN